MNTDERLAANRRLIFPAAAVLLWAAAIFCRLISLQVIRHHDYVVQARKQQERTIPVTTPRGSIYDRDGRPLAVSLDVDSVFVNPMRLPDVAVAADELAPILSLDRNQLEQQFREAIGSKRGFLWVKKKISADESSRLHALNCDWIEFQKASVREYPDQGAAAHIIGGVADEEKGFAGIERSLEKDLKGTAGAERVVRDPRKRVVDSRPTKPMLPGQNLTLTIDARIQTVAETNLEQAVKKHHCGSGTVIVMNPNTGEIYALANYPSYDPAEPPNPQGPDKEKLWNRGVQVPFEPGSIFKVITLTAALETTSLSPESRINCLNGKMALPGRVIHEAHGGYGVLSFADVLAYSSNIGAIQIGMQVGRDKLYDYIQRFGFGARTGVPLPAESPGRLRKLKRWGTTSLASVSMGQEISATSIQLARACSVIANGGYLVQPRVVLKRGDTLEPIDPPKRIIRPETALTMKKIMEGVVLHGTARNTVKVPGYTVAGKTGTAQIFDRVTKHYTHTYNASFMAFAPIKDPAIVVVVTLNGTTGSAGYGGSAAGPVFNEVAAEALRILDVRKDLPESIKPEPKPESRPNSDIANDVAIAGLSSDEPNILDDEDDARPVMMLASQPTHLRVPNFQGKSLREAMTLASRKGIPVVMAGSGIVREQVPLAGEVLLPGQKVRITFSR